MSGKGALRAISCIRAEGKFVMGRKTHQWTATSKMSCLLTMLRAISIHTSLFVPWRGRHGVGHGEALTKATNAVFLTSLHAFLHEKISMCFWKRDHQRELQELLHQIPFSFSCSQEQNVTLTSSPKKLMIQLHALNPMTRQRHALEFRRMTMT